MLALLAAAQFMLIVDITVVQIALPSIGSELELSREALTWVVTTYTLVFGGLMILGGRIADVAGARRTLLVGLSVFTAASLVCGVAGSGAVLIGARAAQGVGAALLSPAALAVVTTTFDGRDRNRALGVWAAIGGTGAAAGVLLGGLLTAGPGWQWVFFVNVPVGVAALALIPLLVRGDVVRGTRERVDVWGAVTVTSATALLIHGVVHAGEAAWGAPVTVGTLLAAAVGYAVFGGVETRVGTPLLRPRTLVRRPVVSGMLLMLVATGLLLGLFFLTSLYLQDVLGMDALATGLLFLPVALAITAGAQVGAHAVGRVGGRVVAVVGLLLAAAGAAVLTQAHTADSVFTGVLPGFVLAAFGIGPVFVAATTTTLANVPNEEAGVASGAVTTFHELGGSIGVALVSTIAASSITDVAAGQAAGYIDGYLACATVAGIGALIALVLVPAGRPQAVAGHGHGVGHGHGHGH
jgi:EmrB/QacA subfamily drug resistance transporter